MDTVTVTVLVGGWWLPRRALSQGETLTLDVATAQALARRGIVRLPEPTPEPEPPAHSVASNARKTPSKRQPKEPSA